MEDLPTTLSEDQIINKEADTGNKPAVVLDIFEPLPKEVPSSEDMVEFGYNLWKMMGSKEKAIWRKRAEEEANRKI